MELIDEQKTGAEGAITIPIFYWFGGSMPSGNQQLTRLSGDVVQPTVAPRVAHFSPKTIFYPPQRADATQIFQ
jgi:hypothetical protein